MYTSSTGIPQYQQLEQPTGNSRRAPNYMQLQRYSHPVSTKSSVSGSLANVRDSDKENRRPVTYHFGVRQTGTSFGSKPRLSTHLSNETASSTIPRWSSDKDASGIRKPSAARPSLSRAYSMASKIALAEVTNLPSNSQNCENSLTTQRLSIRRKHSNIPQATVQQQAATATPPPNHSSTTSTVSATISAKSQPAAPQRATKGTTNKTSIISQTTHLSSSIHQKSTGTVGRKSHAHQASTSQSLASTRSSWLFQATPLPPPLPSARAPASVTANALRQQQQQQHNHAQTRQPLKPPPAPRPPPGARQRTAVQPPGTSHCSGPDSACTRRSSGLHTSRLSACGSRDVAMTTPKVVTRSETAALQAKGSGSSSRVSMPTTVRTTARTTVATTRPGVRIPVRQQTKAVAATAAPTSTDGPQAPRKREPTIPAVSVFNSELFLDADVEMIDANATHGHGRTVSETMAMDVCADEASTDDDYYDPDPVFVSEYQADIFSYKRELEIKLMPKADFMDYQPQLTWHHRMQMIEWLVQVHERFMLLQETLHLCVNFLDRFMSKEIIRADEFQLMGIVALLLASKYEEIQSPSIHALVTLASNTYTAAEIRSGEVRMLRVLQYDLGHPGPMSFLRRISRVDDYNVDLRTMAKYLVDVTLCDHRFLTVPSSMIAALAYRTSMLLLEWHEGWTEEHVKWSGYTEETLMASINVLLTMLEDPKSTHPALFCKYEDPQLLSPSTYVQNLGVKKLEALHF